MKTLLLAALVACAGCASTHAASLRLDNSQAAIRAAETAGALDVPAARTHLDRAKYEQESARQLANIGDERAETVLACSYADAQLAKALAQEASMRSEAEQYETELAQLKTQKEGTR